MKRLGLDSSRHMACVDPSFQHIIFQTIKVLTDDFLISPPYEYWHDGGVLLGWNDFPRQLARRARKAVGLAASEDVRIIGSMLATLKDGAERELAKHTSEFPWVPIDKLKITHAVVSSNDFVALYDEDIRDAAAYANLELLRDAFFTRQPRHAHAAFAGYGLNDNLKQGHVRNATSSESGVSKKNVVAAYLSHSALELSCETKWTNRTCPQAWAQHLDYFSPSLGWPLDGVDDDVEGIIAQSKWGEGVKDLVRRCVRNEIQNHYVNRDDMNVTDVLMLGEKGGPGVFGSMVKEVLEELQSKEPRWHGLVENGGVDRGEAEWKASEGAAQIAWRVLYEPLDAHGDNSECIIEQARKLSPASLIKY